MSAETANATMSTKIEAELPLDMQIAHEYLEIMLEAAPVQYRFVSKDNMVFKVTEEAVKLSDKLSGLVKTLGWTLEEIITKQIPLDNIDGKILNVVFKWCENHKESGEELVSKNIPEFDEEVMKINELFALNLAANSLGIKGLEGASWKKIDSLVEKIPIEDSMIGIVNRKYRRQREPFKHRLSIVHTTFK